MRDRDYNLEYDKYQSLAKMKMKALKVYGSSTPLKKSFSYKP